MFIIGIIIIVFVFQNINSASIDDWIFDEFSFLYITCNNGTLRNTYGEVLTKFNVTKYYRRIDLARCSSNVYAELLSSLNLDFPKIMNILVDGGAPLYPWQFEGLKVEILDLRRIRTITMFKPGILTAIPELKELTLRDMYVPKFPETKLKKLTLMHGKSVDILGGCSELEYLKVLQWNIDRVSGTWLSECKQLHYLMLTQLPIATIKRVLDGASSIIELTIQKCQLFEISPEMFKSQINLRALNVAYNQIAFVIFENAQLKLEHVDLSDNELLTSKQVAILLTSQKDHLVNFSVARNKELDLCEMYNDDIRSLFDTNFNRNERMIPAEMPVMKRLSFANTATKKLCFGDFKAYSLEYIDLSNNQIEELKFQDLPLSTAKRLKEVNLEHTRIQEYEFDKSHYELLKDRNTFQELKLTGFSLSVQCDCSDAWLARAIRDKYLSLDAVCLRSKTRLELTANGTLECDKFRCETCTCRRSWLNGTVTAYCDTNQTTIPQVPNLTHLIAPGSFIAGFIATDLPDTLIELDLTKNHIAKLEDSAVEALFKVRNRRVYLAGNPLVCDCKNVPMLKALKEHYEQVVDYESVTCVDDRPISLLDFVELCVVSADARIWIGAAVILGFGALFAFGAALFYRYERQIKVFLFARGCCPWWLKEDEVDAERPFDAFVSFAHSDDEFVLTHLLPELEKLGYKLCIHYRNWIPGEWIPAQIARSVLISRRTIVVLSKSYLESTWGLMEFRLAHVNTLKEGRPRIIVLMLEDVTKEEMDDELRGYLNSNTYVKWGENWFWDKMKYALPHRKVEKIKERDIEMNGLDGSLT